MGIQDMDPHFNYRYLLYTSRKLLASVKKTLSCIFTHISGSPSNIKQDKGYKKAGYPSPGGGGGGLEQLFISRSESYIIYNKTKSRL